MGNFKEQLMGMVFSCILVLSLFFTPYHVNSMIISQSESYNNSTFSNYIERIEFSEFNDIVKVPPDEIVSSWIVFVDSNRQLELFENEIQHTELQIESIYPNLKAVKLLGTLTEIQELAIAHLVLQSRTPIFPANLLIEGPEETKLGPSGITISAIEDADVMSVLPLWQQGYNGTGVVVGIIDTGADFSHQGLSGQEFASKNFTIQDTVVTMGHGTSVAGVIASTGIGSTDNQAKGISFGSKIASANIGSNANGFLIGDYVEMFDWLAGQEEVAVINTSWGGGGEGLWNEIVDRLEQFNILVVGSAGNNGQGLFNTKGSPGNAIAGISVGNGRRDGVLSGSSSQGPVGGGFMKPDVYAPGTSILTTVRNGGYSRVSGTSFSSPQVAGTAAVLISAMNANNIDWNVGVLKAAILKGASLINEDETRIGQGFVNISRSWELIQEAPRINGIPQLVEATPQRGFFEQLTNLRQEITTKIPFTLISSNASGTLISMSGNISSLISIPPTNQSKFSQAVFLNVDTQGVQTGWYAGDIIIQLENETIKLPLEVYVDVEPTYRALLDLSNTYFDNGYTIYRAGYETGSFIEVMNEQGIWVDLSFQPLSSALLLDYDLLWLADPVWIMTNEVYEDVEINAIKDFSQQGGAVLIHYFGYYSNPFPIFEGDEFAGTDPVKFTPLLDLFDMKMDTEAPSIIDYFLSEDLPIKRSLVNTTSITKGLTGIDTYTSTTIQVGENGIYVSSSNQIAAFSSYLTGRTIVSSTNAWFSSDDANDNPNSNERLMMQNAVQWLLRKEKIEIIGVEKDANDLTIQIKKMGGQGFPTAYLIYNGERIQQNVNAIGNDIYEISIISTINDEYMIEIALSDDYRILTITTDTIPPLISIKSVQTQFMENDFFTFEAIVLDDVALAENSPSIRIDNLDYDNFDYNPNTGLLQVFINMAGLSIGQHVISIQVFDTSNNEVEIKYVFEIEEITQSSDNKATYSFPILSIFVIFPVIKIWRRKKNRL